MERARGALVHGPEPVERHDGEEDGRDGAVPAAGVHGDGAADGSWNPGEAFEPAQAPFGGAVYEPSQRDISSTYWSADYPDAQDYISTNFVCDSFLNISHFCDEDIDAALAATELLPFGPERDQALRDVQQRLIDAVAGVPVMEVTPQVVWGPRVGDIPTLATYAPYDWKRAWVRGEG